ncbi:MAG: hypothetical protein DMG76_31980 [Acidobacteria bacterium]|nr:MAG: hypothetical protein DMG76_31980 [Acidobacteriota bacterium]
MTPVAAAKERRTFDPKAFLSTIDGGLERSRLFPENGWSFLSSVQSSLLDVVLHHWLLLRHP